MKEQVVSRFTPGPWLVGRWAADSVEQLVAWFRVSIEKGDGHQPWQVNVGPDDDVLFIAITGNGPTSEANARLIAAAPELYEVATAMLFWMDKQARKDECYACGGGYPPDVTDECHATNCAAERAREVLAKAVSA